jgi:hypothetical protein
MRWVGLQPFPNPVFRSRVSRAPALSFTPFSYLSERLQGRRLLRATGTKARLLFSSLVLTLTVPSFHERGVMLLACHARFKPHRDKRETKADRLANDA